MIYNSNARLPQETDRFECGGSITLLGLQVQSPARPVARVEQGLGQIAQFI